MLSIFCSSSDKITFYRSFNIKKSFIKFSLHVARTSDDFPWLCESSLHACFSLLLKEAHHCCVDKNSSKHTCSLTWRFSRRPPVDEVISRTPKTHVTHHFLTLSSSFLRLLLRCCLDESVSPHEAERALIPTFQTCWLICVDLPSPEVCHYICN